MNKPLSELKSIVRRLCRTRYLLALLSAGFMGASAVAAQPGGSSARSLTEVEAVEMALARPEIGALSDARRQRAESDYSRAATWTNPELRFARETLETPGADVDEDFIWLSQRFQISGERGLRKEATSRRIDIARLEAEADRLRISATVRTLFFQVLHAQRELAALTEWKQQVEDIEQIVRKRRDAGEVSGYDALRLARERASVIGVIQVETARAFKLRAALAAQLAQPGFTESNTQVEGRLLPGPLPDLAHVQAAAANHPSVRQLAYSADAWALDYRASERRWVPELTLGIGQKQVDDGLTTLDGPMIEAGISVPLFDRGQADKQKAAAEEQIARSEYRLALAETQGEVAGLWRQAELLAESAREQQRTVDEDAAALSELARRAYAGGELGVLELLDAYRSAFEGRRQALETALAARTTRIELDWLAGGPTP